MKKTISGIALSLGLLLALFFAFGNSMTVSAHIITSVMDYRAGTPEDPINLVWWDEGTNANLRNKFSSLGWLLDAYGYVEDVYFWNSENGGIDDWKRVDTQIQDPNGDFWGTRIHVRLYASPCNDPHSFDKYAIGNAHQEHWDWSQYTHVVDNWEVAESIVKGAFMGQSFTGAIGQSWYNNQGTYQNQYSDGYATFIQVIN